MVSGMRNSIQVPLTEMMFSVANAKVIEWPIVNAVTRIRSFFQSPTIYTAQSASTNRM